MSGTPRQLGFFAKRGVSHEIAAEKPRLRQAAGLDLAYAPPTVAIAKKQGRR
ncbi:hypothetical protein [Dyella sp.]|jgi:hypothetical protein|uniref:hypothetical protein n=1 Tax=Dyella sp. TaxID=1869338 RepID=UPI002B9FD27B|nr:hypothetical protein [Dyella sp.]HTC26386.1 hypothetical protein [Dyella sp.]